MKKYIVSILCLMPTLLWAQANNNDTTAATTDTLQPHYQTVHSLGFDLRVGYGQIYTKQAMLNTIGGSNLGLDFLYKLEYRAFRFQTGLGVDYLSNYTKGEFNHSLPLAYPENETLHFDFTNIKEKHRIMEVDVPIMLGANISFFYAMAGVRLGMPVWTSYSQKAELQRTLTNPYRKDAITNTGRIYDTQISSKGKLDLNFDPRIAVELGVNVTPQATNLRAIKGEKLSASQQTHVEIALYGEMGLMNYNTINQHFYQEENPSLPAEKSFMQTYETAPSKVFPWMAGVKVNVFFSLTNKRAAKTNNSVLPTRTDTIFATDTIFLTGKNDTVFVQGINDTVFVQGINDTVYVNGQPVVNTIPAPLKTDTIYVNRTTADTVFVQGINDTVYVNGQPVVTTIPVPIKADTVYVNRGTTDTIFVNQPVATDTIFVENKVVVKDTVHTHSLMSINYNIYFDTNLSDIDIAGMRQLKDIAYHLKQHPKSKVSIWGFADSSGNEQKNMTLSQDRAQAVKKALITEGVNEARIEIKAKGISNPYGDNNTIDGRAMNRRAEIRIVEE